MKKFSPLLFLASLGAGGIAVAPFAFFNYTFSHPKGLVQFSHIPHGDLSMWQEVIFRALEGGMIFFTLTHFILTIVFGIQFIKWLKTKEYNKLISNPLKSAAILAPFISIIMTMNVGIGPIRFFIPQMANSLEAMMIPALITWLVIGFFLMRMEIKLLKTSFEKDFDVSKIHFGWLLHPFALGMYTVTGTGIAALSQNANIAHIAAFISLVFGSMGFFLLIVKMITLFKSHFAASGLPDKQFLPSFLIVIPNITLYAISAFRFGHYLEHYFDAHLAGYFMVVTTLAFAFETWYMLFGFSLLTDYFRKYFHQEFHVTQWGLVCPLVAYTVLGSFVYKFFVQSSILYTVILTTFTLTVILFFTLLYKQMQCAGMIKNSKRICN